MSCKPHSREDHYTAFWQMSCKPPNKSILTSFQPDAQPNRNLALPSVSIRVEADSRGMDNVHRFAQRIFTYTCQVMGCSLGTRGLHMCHNSPPPPGMLANSCDIYTGVCKPFRAAKTLYFGLPQISQDLRSYTCSVPDLAPGATEASSPSGRLTDFDSAWLFPDSI
jgi:hypothetical protein